MRLILISGQSGAGKSVALRALEDLGYYAVDNLPVRLLPALAAELQGDGNPAVESAAAVVDVRSPRHDLTDFDSLFERLGGMGVDAQVLYLGAERDALLERFSETRRRHPLTEGERSLAEALQHETVLLEPLRQRAAIRIDTTRTNVHELRALIQERVAQRETRGLSLLVESFGFKHGSPRDADMVFDVRCLPNPFWKPDLRGLTGRDAAVVSFLAESGLVQDMCQDLHGYLARWIPRFEQENRAYLTVAVGCTGGRHRSVYVVDYLARHLREAYPRLMVRHRELDS